jgi:hypothetical protein
MPGHVQHQRSQSRTRHFETQRPGAPRSTMRYRPDIGADCTDAAYAAMLAHPEIGRPMTHTRDAASAIARPAKIDVERILAASINHTAFSSTESGIF